MPGLKDLTGQVFGQLTVVGRNPENTVCKRPRWDCLCSCGNSHTVSGACLRKGNTRSCGCYQKEHPSRLRHGMSNALEYDIWLKMKARCSNPQDKSYPRYGGRGISYSPAWESFDVFIADMGKRPTNRHTLERVDNNLGYTPENCRWATYTEQARNKSSNRFLEIDGVKRPLSAWAEIGAVTPQHLRGRLRDGWGVKAAVFTPPGIKRERAAELWPDSPQVSSVSD